MCWPLACKSVFPRRCPWAWHTMCDQVLTNLSQSRRVLPSGARAELPTRSLELEADAGKNAASGTNAEGAASRHHAACAQPPAALSALGIGAGPLLVTITFI